MANTSTSALAHETEALSEFELDTVSKQQAITARFNPNNSSALIIAAKRGKVDAINLLLSWGVHIESNEEKIAQQFKLYRCGFGGEKAIHSVWRSKGELFSK